MDWQRCMDSYLPHDWRQSANIATFCSGIVEHMFKELYNVVKSQRYAETIEEAHEQLKAGVAQIPPIDGDDEYLNHTHHALYWAKETLLRCATSIFAQEAARQQITINVEDLLLDKWPTIDAIGDLSKDEWAARFFEDCAVEVRAQTWKIQESPEPPRTSLDKICRYMLDIEGEIGVVIVVEYPGDPYRDWPVWISEPRLKWIDSNGSALEIPIIDEWSKRKLNITAKADVIVRMPITSFGTPQWLQTLDPNIDLDMIIDIHEENVYKIVQNSRACLLREFENIRAQPVSPPTWITALLPEEPLRQISRREDRDPPSPLRGSEVQQDDSLVRNPGSEETKSTMSWQQGWDTISKEPNQIDLSRLVEWLKRDDQHRISRSRNPRVRKSTKPIPKPSGPMAKPMMVREDTTSALLAPDSKDTVRSCDSEINVEKGDVDYSHDTA